jgi:hypothetical protein
MEVAAGVPGCSFLLRFAALALSAAGFSIYVCTF